MDCRKFFYIVSLPRCRSTWLSHLFTTDVTRCYHSLLSDYYSKAFHGLINTDQLYVGSCDEDPVSFLMSEKPSGPIVVVDRDKDDCAESFRNAFELPDDFPVEGMLETYKIALKTIAKMPESISIDFKDLEDNSTIFKIWRHLLPGVPCYIERVMMFQNTVIVVKNRDLSMALDICAKNLHLTKGKYIEALGSGEILKWQQQQ